MGRKKQVRPHRSVGIRERQAAEEQLNEKNDTTAEKEEGAESDELFYIETVYSPLDSEEHYDFSEVVLSTLSISKEFHSCKEYYADSRNLLRFKLSNVKEHLGRMKLGHWPTLSPNSVCLEFVERNTTEGSEDSMIVSGTFDGPDDGITGLVHLASLKLLTIRPVSELTCSESTTSICLRVEILRSMFDECVSLLDNTRQLWKKSMMSVMAWLRPEIMTSEARYGYSAVSHDDVNVLMEPENDLSASRKHARFDISSFYEAIKPSKEAPMLEDNLPDLLPDLRPYQRRAAYWMVQREKGVHECVGGSEINETVSPLCVPINLIDTSRRIYYNPFSGNVSLHPNHTLPYVSGGILADEMGLGKTVELLACIFAHRASSSELSDSSYKLQADGSQNNHFKRVKRERVECGCGAVSESYRYKGLWVQCDICDAWQHADCVGYSLKRKNSQSRKDTEEGCGEGTKGTRKHAKRKNNIKIVEMEGDYICQTCSNLIQATESPVAAGATLIVCPTSILPQWHAEIVRHTNPGSLKTRVYEGVKCTSFSNEHVTDINELLTADIVLTTYDVLKEDLPHDSERHEGDQRSMRYQKRYPVVPTPVTRILWWRICLDEAQMVESNAAAATELALRLHAKHRWCITGTPIQRKLDDLYGLLKFLQASPFDVVRWWTDVICEPYERGNAGAMLFTHNLFKQLMWRSSKVQVREELQLPPQEECISWLSLSPIEEHFYQRQHETCVNDAREVIENFKDDIRKKKAPGFTSSDSSDPFISNVEASKLFNSLLKLRQACCHPQVGSSGLRALQKSPMTMEEILSVLIGKTRVEGEDALRKLVVALNGLAGIAIIKQDFPQAVSLYEEALSLVEDHSEDFRLDPLLNIHIHHNLADILLLTVDSLQQFQHAPGSCKENRDIDEKTECANSKDNIIRDDSTVNIYEKSPSSSCLLRECSNGKNCDIAIRTSKKVQCLRAVSEKSPSSSCLLRECSNGKNCDIAIRTSKKVQCLRAVCEDMKHKFLSVFISKLSLAQQEFRKSYEQVRDALRDRENQHITWWLEALHHINQDKELFSDLIRKIEDALSGTLHTSRRSRISASLRSITTLEYYIQTGLDSLGESRKCLLDRLLEINQTMENPREEDIIRVRYCSKCYSNCDGPACTHCELDELFQVYEARIFRLNKSNNGEVITSVEAAVNMQKKKSALNHFYWGLSRPDNNSALSASDYEDNGKKRDVGENVMVSKAPSDLELMLGIIRSHSRGFLGRERTSAAKKQLALLEGMRKEYAQARSLAIAQAQVLRAHDEIKMATSRLRLKENDDDKSIDALGPGELDIANAENSSEKFLALASLLRIKGQLRYLKGLVQSKQNLQSETSVTSTWTEASVLKENGCVPKSDKESCPVCQEQLSNQKMVFQCGHMTCCKCLFAMTERRLVQTGKSYSNWVMCPTCRQHTDFGNIAYADDSQNESCGSSVQACDKSEASIPVQGSYSTKIEAVTRRILWISCTHPDAKVLVFSSWMDVLDVLQHAFAANGISYVRMKGGRKSQIAIRQFRGIDINAKESNEKYKEHIKTKSVQVLLLLIQHGANGLNLLEAQHVILVEPLLNPAAEAQAVSRVHRIGQKDETLIHRFIMKDTVEESIYKMNKSRNTSSFISGNRKNQDQPLLTLKDVESLFRVGPPDDQKPTGSLRDLPPSAAAAIAAERRLMERTKQ